MKITVLGAGAIGTAVALEFLSREDITQLQVCDARARGLQELHQRVKSARLRSFQIDARDPSVLEPILRGSACVVSCLPPELNPSLARICIDLGAHFCDLGGNDEHVRAELALDEAARAKRLWVVPNCGLAPGLINILCMRGMEAFDEVTAAHLRVGDVPLYPEPPFNFRISWSADKVLDDYTCPVQFIEDGRVVEHAPLGADETIRFREPFDAMEAFSTAGSMSTLIDDLAGKVAELDHKTIRWPGHADQMRFLLGLGFGDNRSIDVRTHLTYRDVLVRRLRQRLGGSYPDAVLLRVLLQGRRDGQDRTLVYEMIERFDEETQTTAMMRCTSIPAATIAYLVASGEVSGGGAAPPERFVPKDRYCDLLADRGLNIETTWHEGHVPVTAP